VTADRRLISIVTVTYRSERYVASALQSAVASVSAAGFDTEIIVVDNDSPDSSVDVVRTNQPSAIIIKHHENVGYGRACNAAFERATGDYWILVNPDAEVDEHTVARLIACLDERPKAGAAGPRIIEGPQAHSENAGMAPTLPALVAHFLFLNRLLRDPRGAWRGFYIRRLSEPHSVRVDWCGAAVLLVRPEAMRDVGGFDPSFFLYGEDVDLGLRLDSAGWEVWFVPSATARHAIAASQPGISTRWVDGTLDVVRRRSPSRVRLAGAIMTAGLAARALFAAIPTAGTERRRHAAVMRASAARALRHTLSG